MYCIAQQISPDKEFKFNQTAKAQLNIQCSMMCSSVVTLDSLEYLVVSADNGQSIAVWTTKRIIYIDVNLSPYLSSSTLRLKSITGERTKDLILLYFDDKSLISCKVKLEQSNDSGSLQMKPFGKADKFCLKSHCLATVINGQNHLNLHNIDSSVSREPIQLENECEQLCLNESGTYVFALVKPRVLFMYRTSDRQQLATLFVYDFVSFMAADNDFVVLAMNDRRLLTLMIADPNDLTIQTKIQSLPSRYVERIRFY
jgi:hypothetical protein